MEEVIILRYGELHLKGKNRGWFEKKLVGDIKSKLKGLKLNFLLQRGRYIISDFNPDDCGEIINRCRRIFGLHSLSLVLKCKADLEEITKTCFVLVEKRVLDGENLSAENKLLSSGIKNSGFGGNNSGVCAQNKTFKVVSHRADKSFKYNSMQLNSLIGARILEADFGLSVDIHNPSFEVNIDVRDADCVFVFSDVIHCAGGMPCGSAGKGLLLLSGGLDSPVAGYMMQRRGLSLDALHFHSYPYTNEQARQKVIELAEILAGFGGKINLRMVKLTQIQEEIRKNCDERYSVIVLRMIMMWVAQMLAKKYGCGCIVNGESLGQVASQTLESLIITDSMASMPVFRPLIGLDKQEIIETAKDIGTFDVSVLPFEDCCTVFLPKHPVTRPNMPAALAEINKIPDLEALISCAISGTETIIM